MTDFLDQKRREITNRLNELKPQVDEYNRLEAAASALASVGGSESARTATTPATRRGPGRPRGSTGRAKRAATAKTTRKTPSRSPGRRAGKRRAGRRKGSGTRAAEALSFVQGQPGITIPELAAKMGIDQNYLYRVMPGLEKEKKLKRKGRGWHPK
jgi:hypothetical protein